MSVSVTVTIGDVQVDASTDATFSPDVLDMVLNHALDTALNGYKQLDAEP